MIIKEINSSRNGNWRCRIPITFLPIVKRSLFRVFGAVAFIALLLALCIAYARFVEPTWIRVRYVRLSPAPAVTVIHISDIHFTGDTGYLERVVAIINGLDADLVCFTGDLIEDAACLDGALAVLAKVNKPLYGIAGNHDRWELRSLDRLRDTFSKTGGEWLDGPAVLVPSRRVALLTMSSDREQVPDEYRRLLLEHHPESAALIRGARFNLTLAGHTHGGQIGIPLLRKALIPLAPDTHDRGLFQVPCGPLYVNPGIGTYYLNMRFLCRPEVTLIAM